ncbi:MAG: DUF898 family protein, partial [Sneathiella sp.]|nr:DUF898 family protein [Sneathiella sp.]
MSEENSITSSGSTSMPWSLDADQSLQPFVTFDVSRKSLAGRLIKNKILGLLTFGFYRFWGKTHIRKLLWQGVKVGQDRLEYHGTAKELFIGFLIGMVVLSVLFTAIGILLQFLTIADPNFLGIEQVVNFALLYGFWQFARYRLWRYRLSRTSLRTVRFFLEGKATVYTGKVLLSTTLSV